MNGSSSTQNEQYYDTPRSEQDAYEAMHRQQDLNELSETPYEVINLPKDKNKEKKQATYPGQHSEHNEEFYESMTNEHNGEFYENITKRSPLQISSQKSFSLPTGAAYSNHNTVQSKSVHLEAPVPPRRKGSLKSSKDERENKEEEMYVALKTDSSGEDDKVSDERYDETAIHSLPKKPIPLSRKSTGRASYEDVDLVLGER